MNTTANEFFDLRDYNRSIKYTAGQVMRMMESYKKHCDKAENLSISHVVERYVDVLDASRIIPKIHRYYFNNDGSVNRVSSMEGIIEVVTHTET